MTTFGRTSLRQPSEATAPGASTPAKGCQASCPFRGGSHAAGALPLGAVDGSPVAEHRDPIPRSVDDGGYFNAAGDRIEEHDVIVRRP